MSSTTFGLPNFGIVDFSNAAPLTRGLPEDRLRRGVPVEVSRWLVSGEVDVGLVPIISCAAHPELSPWLRWGVAADGRCDSVLLFSKVPLADVRRVALDAFSRTSSALTHVLLHREGASDVEWSERAGGTIEERLTDVDATLLIGDPALRAECPDGVTRWDLAKEWKRHVGLPFVFATWACRGGYTLSAEARAELDRVATANLADLPALAREEADRLRLPESLVTEYLGSLQFRLDERHRRGLEAFLSEAWRTGLLGDKPAELPPLEADS